MGVHHIFSQVAFVRVFPLDVVVLLDINAFPQLKKKREKNPSGCTSCFKTPSLTFQLS